MGRVKVQMKKIENKTYRHITFAKRKSGLLKKAYEISTLCDVEVALIIFSPAGNLTLFNGKKRFDQILMHYIDHLYHHQQQHERLRDQELVRRMIAQMSVEAEICHRQASNTMSIDSKLQEIEEEIRMRSAELEDVEKQLQYMYKSPSCIKSASEAEFIGSILEETLKFVSIHKRDMEANTNNQLTISEKLPIHPLSAGSSSLIIMGSSLGNWPHQQYEHDTARVLIANHFPHQQCGKKKNADKEQNKIADAGTQYRDRGLPFSLLIPKECTTTGSSDSEETS